MHQCAHETSHLGRVGVLVDGATHGHTGASARHDVAHLLEHVVAALPRAGSTQKQHGYTDARHDAGDGTLAFGTRARGRDGNLEERRARCRAR